VGRYAPVWHTDTSLAAFKTYRHLHFFHEIVSIYTILLFHDILSHPMTLSVSVAVNCIPLLVQQNINGSNSINRSWAEYKVGFNDTRGNFWLGNDLLHQLTASGRYKLRFDLQATNGNWYYAEYSSFIVTSEASNYLMHVSGYSGNAGNADGYGFLYHAGMRFTTYDRDNDLDSSVNCAAVWGGGFWYTECSWANVNSGRGRGNYFAWHSEIGRRIDLQTSRMWLTC